MTDTANEIRGEVDITLEGVTYVMRPSYEAQVAIERQTGSTIQNLAEAAGERALSIDHAAIIVTECCKAQGKALVASGDTSGQPMVNFNTSAVGELLVDAGMFQLSPRLELLLFLAATGRYTAQGEMKPQANQTTGTPGAA